MLHVSHHGTIGWLKQEEEEDDEDDEHAFLTFDRFRFATFLDANICFPTMQLLIR